MKQAKVFYSYSHKDESYCDDLQEHLAMMQRQGVIKGWHDRKIIPGKNWEEEIDKELKSADVILLLVSSSFLASDYCCGVEMETAMARHEAGSAVVIPVILRSCPWKSAPFASLQALPTDALPVSKWADKDDAWLTVVDGIKDAVAEISERTDRLDQPIEFTSLPTVLSGGVSRVEQQFARRGIGEFPTGLEALDVRIGGLNPGDLVVLASRPEMGREDFLACVAEASMMTGRPVLYVSLHQSAEGVVRRIITGLARIDSQRHLSGGMYEDDWPRFTGAVSQLKDRKFYISERPQLKTDQVVELIEEHVTSSNEGPTLVIVDSVQGVHEVVHGPSSRTGSIQRFIARMRVVARELGICVVVSSSLPASVESRTDKRPFLADLEKYGIHHDDPDVILGLYRDDVYYYESPNRGIVEILILKNREAQIGAVRAVYIPSICRFENLSEELISRFQPELD